MKTFKLTSYPRFLTRRIHFMSYWPFIKICYGGTCMCDINEILDQIK